jgi:hypothetical protein
LDVHHRGTELALGRADDVVAGDRGAGIHIVRKRLRGRVSRKRQQRRDRGSLVAALFVSTAMIGMDY